MIALDILGMKRKAKFLRRAKRRNQRGVRILDGTAFQFLRKPNRKKRSLLLFWFVMMLMGEGIRKRKSG